VLAHAVTPFASDVAGGAARLGSEAGGALTPFLVNGVLARPCTIGDCGDRRSIPAVFRDQRDAAREKAEGEGYSGESLRRAGCPAIEAPHRAPKITVGRPRGSVPTPGPTGSLGDSNMRAPTFGLSITPVMDIKSELRLQLERDLLALVYRSPRRSEQLR
jgi:hypothetical protein